MSEEFADRDHLFVCSIKLCEVMRDRTVEREFAKLYSTRAEQGSDQWLCERGEIVDRVEFISDAIGFHDRVTECISVEDLIAFSYEINCGRKLAGLNMFLKKCGELFISGHHFR